jgi:hypothetical protein
MDVAVGRERNKITNTYTSFVITLDRQRAGSTECVVVLLVEKPHSTFCVLANSLNDAEGR